MSSNYSIKTTDWTSPNKQVFKCVELTIDGDPLSYFFRYCFNKICDVEEETGLNLGAGATGSANARQTRALVCAYLRTAHAVTLEEAGDLLTTNREPTLVATQAAMVLAGIAEAEEEKPEAPAPAAPSPATEPPAPVDGPVQ